MDLDNIKYYKKFLPEYANKLDITHFNDVYNIEERHISGQSQIGPETVMIGVESFEGALNLYNSDQNLLLFSGDLFFPSNMSTLFDGEQIIYPINEFKIDASCLGNHELDMYLERAKKLIKQTN